jgi:hypothetical protein
MKTTQTPNPQERLDAIRQAQAEEAQALHNAAREAAKKEVLTVAQANALAKYHWKTVKVRRDPEDGRLWQVQRPGSVQAHEPMTREAWRAFLETGETEKPVPTSGRHEMVAYSGEGKKVLADVVRDNLSPQAVAAVVRCILTGKRARADIDREVLWLTNLLVSDVLGGPEALDRLVKEAGL